MKRLKKEAMVSLCLLLISCLTYTFEAPQTHNRDKIRAWMSEMGMIPHGSELNPDKIRAIERAIDGYIHKKNRENKPQIRDVTTKLPREFRVYDAVPWSYMQEMSEKTWAYHAQECIKRKEHFYAFQTSPHYRARVMQRIENIYHTIYGMYPSMAAHRIILSFEQQPKTKRNDIFEFYGNQLNALFFYYDGSLRPIKPDRHQSEFFYYMVRELLPAQEFNEYIKKHDFFYRNEIMQDQESTCATGLTNLALSGLESVSRLASTFWLFPTQERITGYRENESLYRIIKACQQANFNQAHGYTYALAGYKGLGHDIIDHYKNKFRQKHYDRWGIANAFSQDPSWRDLNDQEKNTLVSQIPPSDINQKLMAHDQRKHDLQEQWHIPSHETPGVHDLIYELAHGSDEQIIEKLHDLEKRAQDDPDLKKNLAKLKGYLPGNMRTLAEHYDDAKQTIDNLDKKIESAKSEEAQQGLYAQKKALENSITHPFDMQKSHAQFNEQAQEIINQHAHDPSLFTQDIIGNEIQRHIHQELAESLNAIATDTHIQDKELPDAFYQSTLKMIEIAQVAAAHGDYDKACAISHYLSMVAQFSDHIHDDELRALDTLQRVIHSGDVLNNLPDMYQDVIQAGAYTIVSGFDQGTIRTILSNIATTQKGEFACIIRPDMNEIVGHINTIAGSLCCLGLNSFCIAREISSLLNGNMGEIFPLAVSSCAAIRDVYHIIHEVNQINAHEYYAYQDGRVENGTQYPEISAFVDKATYSVVLAGTIVYAANLIRAGCRLVKRVWDARHYLKIPLNPLENPTARLPKDVHPDDFEPVTEVIWMVEENGEMVPDLSNSQLPVDPNRNMPEVGSGGITSVKEPNKNLFKPAKVLQALKNVTQEIPNEALPATPPIYTPEQLQEIQDAYQAFRTIFKGKVDDITVAEMQKHGIGSNFKYDLEHCLCGHVTTTTKGPRLTGVHSEWIHKNCVIAKGDDNIYKVYYARIRVNGLEKQSTMWPDTYGPAEISRDTAEALNNIEDADMKNGFFVILGRAKSGILVEIKLNKKGEIDTSYPALKNKKGVLQVDVNLKDC